MEGEVVEQPLARFLEHQPNRQIVGLPYYFGTPGLVEALGKLPKLEAICLNKTQVYWTGQGISWVFKPGAFRRLWRSIAFAYESVAAAIGVFNTRTPAFLSSFHLAINEDRAQNGKLTVFLLTLVASCPGLESVSLTLFCGERSYNDGVDRSLKLAVVAPLLECKGLKSLDIYDNQVMVLSREDVLTISRSWPWLEHLHVTVDPERIIPDTDGKPLSALAVFEENGPASLCHLRLYLKVISRPISEFSLLPIVEPPNFIGWYIPSFGVGVGVGSGDDGRVASRDLWIGRRSRNKSSRSIAFK